MQYSTEIDLWDGPNVTIFTHSLMRGRHGLLGRALDFHEETVGSIPAQIRLHSNVGAQNTCIGGQNVQDLEILHRRFDGVLSLGGNVVLVKSSESLPKLVQDYKPISLP